MNLAQMANRFYQDLKHPNTNRIPLSLFKEYIDEAERAINKRTRTIDSSSIIDSISQAVVKVPTTYSFPTDLLDWFITDVYYSTTTSVERRRLVPISIKDLDKITRKWREITGPPQYWYIDKINKVWGVVPCEKTVRTGTNCIEIKYKAKHTKLTRLYFTGTVDVVNGSATVAGSGTAFIGNVVAGDELGIGSLLSRSIEFPTTFYAIESTPTLDDSLTLSDEYAGADASAQTYIISTPSSIENDELNLCCILYAMGLARRKEGEKELGDTNITEALSRAEAEMQSLRSDAYSEEAEVPEGYAPYPGTELDDYGR